MKFRAPANVLLRRAQLVLILAALVPTVLMTSLGIILIAKGSGAMGIVVGSLVLAFCTSALTGYILVSIFLSRGASLARIQNDYISAVSHELRTPLTSLRMFLDTIRQGRVDPEERDRCLLIMDKEMARLDVLVTRLHDLSRIEMARHPPESTIVLLDDVVTDALASFKALSLAQPVEVETAVATDVRVKGDRLSLVQALVNLLGNAWKYTGREKRIRLSVQPAGKSHVELCVSDNGPGIPEAERTRIFQPFERGKAATETRAEGSGLGLAIVRGIVRNHGGRLDVKSSSPAGTEMRIVLPRRVRGA